MFLYNILPIKYLKMICKILNNNLPIFITDLKQPSIPLSQLPLVCKNLKTETSKIEL